MSELFLCPYSPVCLKVLLRADPLSKAVYKTSINVILYQESGRFWAVLYCRRTQVEEKEKIRIISYCVSILECLKLKIA
jgi:hypothetical protein